MPCSSIYYYNCVIRYWLNYIAWLLFEINFFLYIHFYGIPNARFVLFPLFCHTAIIIIVNIRIIHCTFYVAEYHVRYNITGPQLIQYIKNYNIMHFIES